MVEARKEYVLAAKILEVRTTRILLTHILPNVMTPVLVTATLNLGLAILSEATLSFLGVGMPVTQPSLGTLIRIGNQYFFSGSWWVVLFPAFQLGLIILLVVIALVLPLIYMARGTRWYATGVMPLGSCVLGGAGIFWLFQRL